MGPVRSKHAKKAFNSNRKSIKTKIYDSHDQYDYTPPTEVHGISANLRHSQRVHYLEGPVLGHSEGI